MERQLSGSVEHTAVPGLASLAEPSGAPVLDLALRTFAFGLFPRPGGNEEGEKDEQLQAECWESVEEAAEIAGAPGFTTLACGRRCCLGITPEGDVHRWDACSRSGGALSRSFGVEWSLSALRDEAGQCLQLRDAAISQASTSSHGRCSASNKLAVGAIALMDSGDVYTTDVWHGAPGDDAGCTCPTWRPVPCLQSHLVVSVACGAGFCMALTANGDIWAWGETLRGSLGIGGQAAHADEAGAGRRASVAAIPALVQGELSGRRIAAVACGESHSIAATFDELDGPGGVYAWGCASDLRLGYEVAGGTMAVQAEPRLVPWITAELGDTLRARREGARRAEPNLSAAPAKRSTLRLPQRVTQLGCGSRHSVVLCQGSVICFGADDCGQLGRPVPPGQPPPPPPAELPSFASSPALAPAPADTAACRGGGLRVGNSASSSSRAPRAARAAEESARRICCGPLHSAAVAADGGLHVWGLRLALPAVGSEDGPSCASSCGPRRVRGFGERRPVVALACGAHFVVASAEVELPAMASSTPGAMDFHMGALWQTGGSSSSAAPGDSEPVWRPANLPPKGAEELLRHRNMVRELERNAQRRLEREQREDRLRRLREEQRERRLQEHTEIWLRQLLPSFVPGSRPSRRMERLWRQGLPPRVREVLWPMAIGNVLRITPELFEIHKRQALDARRSETAAASNVLITLSEPPKSHGKERSTECIPLDLPRTFPTLAFFNEGGPLHEDCARILEAYTFFRPDIGYVQGMSFLAAVLLLYLPPYPAFVGLCNLINSPSVLGLYRLVPRAVECRAALFRRLCAAQLPAVARLIEDVGLTPEMFLIEWFMTLYSKCLPIDVASVIWDLFLLDGEVVLYCTALALLRISEPALLCEADDLASCARILGEELRARVHNPDELLRHVHEVWRRAPPQLLAEIRGIEMTEFGPATAGHSGTHGLSAPPPSGGYAAAPLPPRSFLEAVKDSLTARWAAR